MATSQNMAGTWINLFLLDELASNIDLHRESQEMTESIWSRTPTELVDQILQFLPAASQARFRTVCKRWGDLMTSPEFLEKTRLVALSRGYPCILYLGAQKQDVDAISQWCKGWRVEMPDLELPPGRKRLFGGATSVPLVGVACVLEKSLRMRVWLIDIPDRTWDELPCLDLKWHQLKAEHPRVFLDWNIWLVRDDTGQTGTAGRGGAHSSFKVCVLDSSHDVHLHTISSSDGEWRTARLNSDSSRVLPRQASVPGNERALVSNEKYVVATGAAVVRVSFDGAPVSVLPPLPRQDARVLSNPVKDAVFALGSGDVWLNLKKPNETPGLYLYVLDLGKPVDAWVWKRLLSGKVPYTSFGRKDRSENLRQNDVRVKVLKAQIVGDVLLMLAWVRVKTTGPAPSWAMAYHLLDRSCRWQRVHPTIGARGFDVAKLQLFALSRDLVNPEKLRNS